MHAPSGVRNLLIGWDGGVRRQVPWWVATDGRQIILWTFEGGRPLRVIREATVEVDTRLIRVCLSVSNFKPFRTVSTCAGRRQRKTIELLSTIS